MQQITCNFPQKVMKNLLQQVIPTTRKEGILQQVMNMFVQQVTFAMSIECFLQETISATSNKK